MVCAPTAGGAARDRALALLMSWSHTLVATTENRIPGSPPSSQRPLMSVAPHVERSSIRIPKEAACVGQRGDTHTEKATNKPRVVDRAGVQHTKAKARASELDISDRAKYIL